MTDYTKTTDFTSKDSLPSGDSGKIIRGAEFGTEFDNIQTAVNSKSNKENPSFTGNITVTGTVDGRDISADGTKLDTIETSADVTDTANVTAAGAVMDSELTDITAVKALNQGVATTDSPTFAAVTSTGNVTVGGTVDGRDVATDGTKLDTVETNADVTDTTNVTAAGALMDSEVTNLAQVKAFDSADYATAAQGATADAALPRTGGAMTGAITTNSTFDGRDVATDGTKLDGIEALADVTDTTNVTAAGALMDSELTDIAAVKALNQGVATTDSPTFAGLTTTADVSFGDNDKAIFGAGSDLEIYHDGSHSYVSDQGTGRLVLNSSGGGVRIEKSPTENMAIFTPDGNCELFYDNSLKLATSSTGIDVTGVITTDGLTTSADINFGDNDKAVFGAGSDLQIYHDGSNSYVEDTGDGALFLKTNGSGVFLYSGSEALATFNLNGASNLYYDNGLKLSSSSTGIDVTGTATMDGLTVTGSDAALAASIGTAAQRVYITPDGTEINYNASGNSAGSHMFQTGNLNRLNIASNGDISFYEDTGTTAKLFWDASAESLGIGTSTPQTSLSIETSGTQDVVSPVVTGQTAGVTYGGLYTVRDGAGDQRGLAMQVFTANVGLNEAMRIDSSGNLLVGTPVINSGLNSVGQLEVSEANAGGVIINTATAGANNYCRLMFSVGNATGNEGLIRYNTNDYHMSFWTEAAERMRIDSTGNLRVGVGNTFEPVMQFTNSGRVEGNPGFTFNGDLDTGMFNPSTQGTIAFSNNGSESMRIDASGNLLVGTTSIAITDEGFKVFSNGVVYGVVDNAQTNALWNKEGYTSGTTYFMDFRLDSVVKGSISSDGTSTSYNTSSDQRLKDNIVDAPSASDDIDAIQVRSFDWKVDGSHQKYGMVAQELNTVAPEAVSAPEDPEDMMGVDYSKLVPMLVKEIQSLRARVAQLETN